MVCAARTDAARMLSTSSRSSRQRFGRCHVGPREVAQDDVGERDQWTQRIVEIVSHAAGQNAQCLHPLGGGDPFVEQGLADDFLVEVRIPERCTDLVAEHLIARAARVLLEHGDA